MHGHGLDRKVEGKRLIFVTAIAGQRRLHGSEDDQTSVFHWLARLLS